MSEQIDISAETARKLHRVEALTGRSAQELLNDILDAQLEALQLAALRSAVAEGIADADAGRFSDRSIADMFSLRALPVQRAQNKVWAETWVIG